MISRACLLDCAHATGFLRSGGRSSLTPNMLPLHWLLFLLRAFEMSATHRAAPSVTSPAHASSMKTRSKPALRTASRLRASASHQRPNSAVDAAVPSRVAGSLASPSQMMAVTSAAKAASTSAAVVARTTVPSDSAAAPDTMAANSLVLGTDETRSMMPSAP
eukprot:scaffold15512_cov110-Isochrysis_galbana.AAC.4